jgi:hypothetical protein
MTRYHATPQGNIPFTPEEEAEWDAREAEWAAGESDRKASEIREQRNRLLAETDWMAGSDVTMSDDWKTYRQELRDITLQDSFPDSVTWPDKP